MVQANLPNSRNTRSGLKIGNDQEIEEKILKYFGPVTQTTRYQKSPPGQPVKQWKWTNLNKSGLFNFKQYVRTI